MKQEIARESSRGNAKLRVSRLPFSEIPHGSRLFIEYQRDPVSLKRFYPNAVESAADVFSFVPKMLASYSTDREELCDALFEINSEIGSSEKTFDNIRLLREPDTVAVVTGQQAGLFTGPLYTIYKALSAIKMAEMFSQNNTNAVPVFWIATEDHDFSEVSETFFIQKTGELSRSKYLPNGYVKNSPVGNVGIDDEIVQVIDEIFANLPSTQFSTEMRKVLASSWAEGTLFGEAFAKTLIGILGKFGIIVIDPMNERIKNLSAPIYADAVKKADAIVAGVMQKSGELKSEGFHAQVLVEDDYFPLFWHDDNGRRIALRKIRDGIYRAKDDKREFTLSELEKIAKNEPQRFSPGVMLRPVVQDFLLPTVCYFGGAAEIAYFAQNSEVYRVLDRPITPIFHRQSFTIVESKHRRVLDKLNLGFPQLFEGVEKTMLNLAETNVSPKTTKLFAGVEEKISNELNRLDQSLSQIDPTLAANLAGRRRKIIYHIAALRKKTLLAQTRKDDTTSRQIENVFTSLLPKGQLQERSVNVFTYLNKFGLNFIDWNYEAIDLEDNDHRIIDL